VPVAASSDEAPPPRIRSCAQYRWYGECVGCEQEDPSGPTVHRWDEPRSPPATTNAEPPQARGSHGHRDVPSNPASRGVITTQQSEAVGRSGAPTRRVPVTAFTDSAPPSRFRPCAQCQWYGKCASCEQESPSEPESPQLYRPVPGPSPVGEGAPSRSNPTPEPGRLRTAPQPARGHLRPVAGQGGSATAALEPLYGGDITQVFHCGRASVATARPSSARAATKSFQTRRNARNATRLMWHSTTSAREDAPSPTRTRQHRGCPPTLAIRAAWTLRYRVPAPGRSHPAPLRVAHRPAPTPGRGCQPIPAARLHPTSSTWPAASRRQAAAVRPSTGSRLRIARRRFASAPPPTATPLRLKVHSPLLMT
jgi:hypothetical protein